MRSSNDATGSSNHNNLNMNDLNKNLASNEESKFKQTYLGGGGRNSEDASAHQSNVAMRYEHQRPSGAGNVGASSAE